MPTDTIAADTAEVEEWERVAELTVGQLRDVIREELAAEPESDARMIWIQDLAEQKGLALGTIYEHLKKHDIPKRQKTGHPKPPGSKSYTYIFSLEYEGRERMDTRSVRRALGKAGQL